LPLIWTSRARHDLAEIYVRLHFHSAELAERTVAALDRRTAQIEIFPRSGTRRADIGPHIRVLPHGSYLILYELYPDEDDGPIEIMEIIRVLDGSFDLKKALV
jgi:toxin ParE1/3/4